MLFSERDTLDFSLNELAARSGLNHGLIGYYFGGKEGLLLALLKRDADRALTALKSLVESDIDSCRKIELHIRGIIDTYFKYPYMNRLINLLQDGDDAKARELAEIFILPLRSYQAALLDQACTDRKIRSVDSAYFYFIVIGACEFLFHSRRTLPYTIGVQTISDSIKDDYADEVVGIVMRGISVAP